MGHKGFDDPTYPLFTLWIEWKNKNWTMKRVKPDGTIATVTFYKNLSHNDDEMFYKET